MPLKATKLWSIAITDGGSLDSTLCQGQGQEEPYFLGFICYNTKKIHWRPKLEVWIRGDYVDVDESMVDYDQ